MVRILDGKGGEPISIPASELKVKVLMFALEARMVATGVVTPLLLGAVDLTRQKAAAPLAPAGISVFGISTFDTDYLLVNESDFERALVVLQKAGHSISG